MNISKGIDLQASFRYSEANIQNHRRVLESDATQMSVVAPTILDFGRIVLNFISYF